MIQESSLSDSHFDCELRSTPQQVVMRNLELEDLTRVAGIHSVAFPDSALTKLGVEAVRRYYKWLLEGPHDAIRIGAFVDSKIVGFCFGGVFRGAMSGFLRANQLFLCSRVLIRPWMAANPIFRNRVASAVRILSRTKNRQPQLARPAPAASKPFGILAIAVSPDRQGLGVGRLLMQKSEDIARQRGFQEMILTVSTSNDQAISFYENLQWVKIDGEDAWHGGMRKPLRAQAERTDLPGANN